MARSPYISLCTDRTCWAHKENQKKKKKSHLREKLNPSWDYCKGLLSHWMWDLSSSATSHSPPWEQKSICPALEVSPGKDVLEGQCCSQQKMPCFLDRILLGPSYGMLSSCQHSPLAHSALSPPCLCFPRVSQGSSQVPPCQALPMAHAPAPLELIPAPAPAHIHFFQAHDCRQGLASCFQRG